MPKNGNFFKKYQLLALFGVLEVKLQFLAVLRHLEGFLEKSEESRPPLKLKNNGGQLFSLGCFFQKIGVSAIYFFVNPFRDTVYLTHQCPLHIPDQLIHIHQLQLLNVMLEFQNA